MPLLVVLAGPNGAGKSTFHREIIEPVVDLPFINADEIARERWPGRQEAHGYEAARVAQTNREAAFAAGSSFVTETVFSHASKLDLIRDARKIGYHVVLHVILVPVAVCVARVQLRVEQGEHSVPEEKIRSRYARLGPLLLEGLKAADEGYAYDNSNARHAYRLIAKYRGGTPEFEPQWPRWSPIR